MAQKVTSTDIKLALKEFHNCTYFDLISPNRSQCIRYWGVKPKKKRGKGK